MNDNVQMLVELCKNEGIVDRHLEQMAGQDARDEIELDKTFTRAEFQYVISGIISGYNEAIESGDFSRALIFHSLLDDFLEEDEEIAEKYDEAQEQPSNPLEAMMQSGEVLGGTIEFDDDDFDGFDENL